MTRFVAPLLVSAVVLTFAPNTATAQTKAEKPAPAVANANQQIISIELRDAPIRKALERLFDAVKADFMIEGTIKAGTITARVKDQPFETVLKVLLEASSTPLLYEREGDVYIIFPKPEPKPAPEPAKVAQVEEKPDETILEENPSANNPIPQGYYAPTYQVLPVYGNWQIGGLSIGQSFHQGGNAPLQFGAPIWPGIPGNIIFANSQPGWGGFGGFGRFP
jgi:hypothetical protein